MKDEKIPNKKRKNKQLQTIGNRETAQKKATGSHEPISDIDRRFGGA
jgi:hypothetical protein